MSRPTRRLRILAWMVVWTYLAMGLQPFDALVLCIDAQGHVALEAATADGACFDCPEVLAPDVAGCCADEERGDDARSCDCVDVVLVGGVPDARLPSSSPAFDKRPMLAAIDWSTPVLSAMRPGSSFDRNGMQRPPGGRGTVRTFVLRI